MPTQQRHTTDAFSSIALTWATYCGFAQDFVVAVRGVDGWHLRWRYLELLPRAPATVLPPLEVRTPSVYASRRVFSPVDAQQSVRDFLSLGGQTYIDGTKTSLGLSSEPRAHLERHQPIFKRGPLRLPSLFFIGDKLNEEDIPTVAQLELELMACEKPFGTLLELLGEFAGQPDHANTTVPGVAMCTIFPPLEVESFAINNGMLEHEIWMPKGVDISDLKCGVIAYHSASQLPTRTIVPTSSFSWTSDNDGYSGKISYRVNDAPLTSTMFTYAGEHVARYWSRDPRKSFNPFLQVHRLIDPTTRLDLIYEGTQTSEFEDRVNLLLNMIGARSLHYGRISVLTDAPDILTLSETHDLYVIECTTGRISNNNKLQKLALRTEALVKRIREDHLDIRNVVPVLVTNLTRDETREDWPQVRSRKISLICREQLQELVNRIDAPPGADEAHRWIIANIPAEESRSE